MPAWRHLGGASGLRSPRSDGAGRAPSRPEHPRGKAGLDVAAEWLLLLGWRGATRRRWADARESWAPTGRRVVRVFSAALTAKSGTGHAHINLRLPRYAKPRYQSSAGGVTTTKNRLLHRRGSHSATVVVYGERSGSVHAHAHRQSVSSSLARNRAGAQLTTKRRPVVSPGRLFKPIAQTDQLWAGVSSRP